ncbi:uncharacterized protein TM35_000251030 [Trypanosoma theileri]|uniref:Uncharacterized protein n=1 Tax=Trypanosoma theileri TaxID=67003 RepID=A0A1X0NQ46_9TRYP|nr:uncharacterized protein TM35_000251030 [Trypanosoma theileri]ORC86807.1 hypothetical protein TM35_000251030 [Trypanosoma theileri]
MHVQSEYGKRPLGEHPCEEEEYYNSRDVSLTNTIGSQSPLLIPFPMERKPHTPTRTKQIIQSNNTVKNKQRECWQTMIGYNRGSSSREAYGTLYSTLAFPNQSSVFTKCIPWYTQHTVDLSGMSQLLQRIQQSKQTP